jgi:C4-dicarboxylate-specific signal transduction histidine kinase
MDMMATGFIAAVIINHVVNRLTKQHRQQLREAHASLESRVRERTSELQAANRALREAQDELLARDRMATAGMVAAGVSHEIRSPLNVIRIAVDEITEMLGGSASPDIREYLTDMSDSTDQMTTILKDLTTIARPVDDLVTTLDLADVVATATRLASYRFGNGVTLERGPCDARVVGSASPLVQLITNLLHNAARAKRPDAINTIRIDATTIGDNVVLRVRDTGTGMPPEVRARLFEPFFTTGRATGGTGLGLTICRSIAERMGGSIAIESEQGRGTTVSVTLKRA